MTISEVIEKFASRDPGRVALILYDGKKEVRLTYLDLYINARKKASYLHSCGVKKSDIVLISMDLSAELIFSFLGAVFYGSPPLLFSISKILADKYYLKNMNSLIEKYKIKWVLLDDFFYLKNKKSLNECSNSLHYRILHSKNKLSSDLFFDSFLTERDLAFLQQTSGTTGLQKICSYTYWQVIHHTKKLNTFFKKENKREDIIVSWLPLYHDLGLMAAFFFPLLNGIKCVLISPKDFIFSPSIWIDALSKYRGTITWSPNFAFSVCVERINDSRTTKWDLSCVKFIGNASEMVSFEAMERFYQRFSQYGLKKKALNCSYGAAEYPGPLTITDFNSSRINTFYLDRKTIEAVQKSGYSVNSDFIKSNIKLVGLGKPLQGTKISIRDGNGKNLSDGKVGRVFVKSDTSIKRYYNNESESNEKFVSGWIKTGDVGLCVSGEFFFLGRDSEIINIAGVKYLPSEIEQETLNTIIGVRKGCSAVFGVYDNQVGTNRLVMLVESYETDKAEKLKIKKEIRKRTMGVFGLSCSDIILLPRGTLKKTTSGKKKHFEAKKKYLCGQFNRYRNE